MGRHIRFRKSVWDGADNRDKKVMSYTLESIRLADWTQIG